MFEKLLGKIKVKTLIAVNMSIDKTYMVDAPESREDVTDIFGATNVLEKDTIEHNDKTSNDNITDTILDTGDTPKCQNPKPEKS